MLTPYKGTLYRGAADPAVVELVESDELHTMDYDDVLAFYRDFVHDHGDADLAYLGAVDRYFLLTNLLGRFDAFHPWLYDRCREVELEPDGFLDLWGRGMYKAVDVNEPVLTPAGWRAHGDLVPGDEVFGPDGKPTRVVARTEVFHNADCYRVSFSDGYSVVVSGDHLWTVDLPDKSRINGTNARKKWKRVTISTRELLRHVDLALAVPTRRFPVVPVAAAIQHSAKSLPLDPYVLGVWLGDGATGGTRVTAGHADAEEMQALLEATGVRVRVRRHSNCVSLALGSGVRGDRTSSDVTNALRALGVYRNKRIPGLYIAASEKQRWALLQGLMDTDGSCSCGQAIFCAANAALAGDVFDLAQSLGLKPTIAQRHGLYRGQPRPYWHVSFRGRSGCPPFRLARKIAACSSNGKDGARRIVGVQPVEARPVSCIQVDRADGLYLIGRNLVTTHNSTIITFAGTIQEIVNDPEITIGIFAHTKGIASKFVAQIKREFEANQDIRTLYPEICWVKPRSEAPIWSEGAFTVRRRSNPKEATVEGHGVVDGQPTSKHFKILHYDDLVTLESVSTTEQVKKTTEAFELSTNLGSKQTRRKMIGTRYHFGDSYASLIEKGVVIPRIYPATLNGKLDGEPVFLSQEEWDKKKRDQASTVAAQMLQNPLSGKERTFLPTWFKPWFVRPASMNVYIMGDPSRGRTAKSDRTAIAVLGLDSAGNKYLLDGARHRMTLSQRWEHLKHFYQRWSKVPGVNFVKVGYERYGQQSDDEYFVERQRAEKVNFAIEELAWPREGGPSKQHRVERLQPDVQFGSFFFPGLVWRSGKICTWQVSDDGDRMEFREMKDAIKDHTILKARGQDYLCAKQITRRDEENKVYDLTIELMDEMMYFPFGLHDDLVDVTSRIYDMEAVAASMTDVLPDEPDTID